MGGPVGSLDAVPDGVQRAGTTEGAAEEYAALKRRVVERALLEKRPLPYAVTAAALAVVFVGAWGLLLAVDVLWVRVLLAALLGALGAQTAFIAHDIGHRAVMEQRKLGDVFGLILGNFIMGISRTWWIDKHNAHHSHPNEIDADPDIDIPFVAFSESQALEKRGAARWTVKYQAYLLFPIMALVGVWSWHVYSVSTVLGTGVRYAWAERLLLLGHFLWFFGLVAVGVGGWDAVVVVLVHHAVMGLHLGSVFAPNHKGMLVLESGSQLDFLRRQVLTSRNVRPSVLIDFLYGGLNYQIEHHLFPNMPRTSLGEARRIVRAFCAERGISHHETGVLQSFREVLGYLHAIGAPLRRGEA